MIQLITCAKTKFIVLVHSSYNHRRTLETAFSEMMQAKFGISDQSSFAILSLRMQPSYNLQSVPLVCIASCCHLQMVSLYRYKKGAELLNWSVSMGLLSQQNHTFYLVTAVVRDWLTFPQLSFRWQRKTIWRSSSRKIVYLCLPPAIVH